MLLTPSSSPPALARLLLALVLLALVPISPLASAAGEEGINAPQAAAPPLPNSRFLPGGSAIAIGKVPSVETQGAGMTIDTGHQGGTGLVPCPQFCRSVVHAKGDVYYTCSWGSYGPASSPFVEYIPHTQDNKTCLTAGIPLDVEPRHRLFVHGLHANSDTWNHWSARVSAQMDYMGYKTIRDNTGHTKDWGDGSAPLIFQVNELAGQINAGFGAVPDRSVEVYAHSLGALKMEALLQLGYLDGAKCNWNPACNSAYFQAARKIGRVYMFQGAHGGCAATSVNGDFPNHGILPGCPATKDIGRIAEFFPAIPGTSIAWDMNLIVWRGRSGQEKHIHYVAAHSNGGKACQGAVKGLLCKSSWANDGVVYAWQMVPTWYFNFEDARKAGYVSSSPGNAEPGNYCHMRIGNDKEDSYDPPRLSDDLMNRYVGIRTGLKYLVPIGRVANTYSRDVIDCPDSCFCVSDQTGACRNRINCTLYGGQDCSFQSSGGNPGGNPSGGPGPFGGTDTTLFRQTRPGSWTACATEGATCAFSGSRPVRYGAVGTYVIQMLSNGTRCTSEVFGDPVPGITKSCEYGDEVREPLGPRIPSSE